MTTKSIERSIKDQYAKFFEESDWHIFKKTADFYFETAAKLLKKDILYEEDSLKLLRRNTMKRLFIGIGCELLLKAIYLKNGFCINKPKNVRQMSTIFPYKFSDIDPNDFKDDDTLSFNQLIEKLFNIQNYGEDKDIINKGLRISKVFRNKEGHIVVSSHKYVPQNYKDIEECLIRIYEKSFNEKLQISFSMSKGEKAIFNIKKI